MSVEDTPVGSTELNPIVGPNLEIGIGRYHRAMTQPRPEMSNTSSTLKRSVIGVAVSLSIARSRRMVQGRFAASGMVIHHHRTLNKGRTEDDPQQT
jgi:hypothetical protein